MAPRRSIALSFLCLAAGLCLATPAAAQTSQEPVPEARKQASDYPASAAILDLSIGAESLARSVPVPGGMLFAENHLVVEVAIYGPKARILALSPEQFQLTINGGKIPLLADSPYSVAAGMRDSAWNRGPRLEASGSVGGAGVILGRRRVETGVPDLDGRTRGSNPPRVPDPPDRYGAPPREPMDLRAEIERVALAQQEYSLPVSRLVFFPYTGKLKSIKTVTLEFSPPGAAAPVKLPLAH